MASIPTNMAILSQSVKLYATSATISVTKFWPETHIALPTNVANQLFQPLKMTEPPLGPEAFLT